MMTGSTSSLDEVHDGAAASSEAVAGTQDAGGAGVSASAGESVNEGVTQRVEGVQLDSVRVVANGDEEADEITPVVRDVQPNGYGATDSVASAGGGGKKDKGKKDKGKSGEKKVADALKTDMAAERTFFKWLWTGLHTGAIGSFIFVTFDGNKEDPMRLVVVGFSWMVALGLVLYGTFAYYRRRRALRRGSLEEIPEWTREHSPLVVVLALVSVVGVALGYAVLGGDAVAAGGNATGAGGRGGLSGVFGG
eukprot:GFKZ01002406.1.p1 GENE.GFKZ01002406.1~~GFKZ01002406.1.p1  ORF type:complete len:250 (+),score=46.61 GFKZ01002406.1:539-1288(+)